MTKKNTDATIKTGDNMSMRSDYLENNKERKYSQHEQYNSQYEKKSVISNLKINVTTLKKMLIIGGFVIAGTIAAPIVVEKYVEYDNAKFEQENERYNNEIYELNGSTADEIVERGKSR